MTEARTIDAAERALMAATVRGLAEELDGTELAQALDAFGFAELLAEAPRDAVSALFTALGRAGSMSTSLQDVLLQPLAAYLPAATTDCNVVLPGIGADLVGATDGEPLAVHGLVIGARPALRYLAPVAIRGELAWIDLQESSGISTRRVDGLDPALAITEVTGVDVTADMLVAGKPAVAAWEAVATGGRLALGYQIIGAVGQMIDLAVEHARSRVQFGRPIGSFQAVRTRLADAHVAREGAAAALASAWAADDPVLAGLLAKSLAGRAARIAATHCQQVLAGIGFTAEHPFHRFLARAMVLDSVLGSASQLPAVIGAHLISAGKIPRLVDL
ncbi:MULTISPECIES: acyl-CoA dehydrogenase family protein [Mycobacterium]|uniref:Acyl-CoA dehydrogenase n=3 Tax=Mycobacterium TaxID=1763 RepID=A0A7I7YAU4_9MYCO|nr:MULTISPECIES: acyl-CoA dehydrogenase family protein [Mycobacterium]BBZ38202.1 acyl-CoA dehydrogenase [Mycobacterium conspicuum]BBZ48924.1 acyl-CoA dehydrogenase [Mycobacterium heidelbergense]